MGDYTKFIGLVEKYHTESEKYCEKYGITAHWDMDAFRHAYSTARMTQEYSGSTALLSGAMWEVLGKINGADFAETNMDLWNNYQGYKIGSTSNHNPDELAQKVFKALIDGRLIRDPHNDLRQFFLPPELQPYSEPTKFRRADVTPSHNNEHDTTHLDKPYSTWTPESFATFVQNAMQSPQTSRLADRIAQLDAASEQLAQQQQQEQENQAQRIKPRNIS